MSPTAARGFRHEALLYAGIDELVARTVPFVRGALLRDEPILVALDASKIARLQRALGAGAADRVRFVDMRALGANPARILPAWLDFVEAYGGPGRRVRGIGEPVWAERSRVALHECYCHESLLNVAFAEQEDFWLLCPYDTSTLGPETVAAASETHPVVFEGGMRHASRSYTRNDTLAEPLTELDIGPEPLRFGRGELGAVRACVESHARAARIAPERARDLVVAVNEVATNAVIHGDGTGELRVWRDDDMLVCECRGRGRLGDPLIGRRRPTANQGAGFGLWIANQVCDLVQVRSTELGTVVRIHFARR